MHRLQQSAVRAPCRQEREGRRRVDGSWTSATTLPVVDEGEACAFSGTGVEGAVESELERSDGVRGVLLTPVLDEHLLVREARCGAEMRL